MNVVVIIGNLTRDPEVRYKEQLAICKFTVAVSDGYGNKKTTSYIPVTVFGKTAENCEKFLAKGSKAAVKGRIQTGSYEGKNGKVNTTEVIADQVEFLSQSKSTEVPEYATEPSGYTALESADIPF